MFTPLFSCLLFSLRLCSINNRTSQKRGYVLLPALGHKGQALLHLGIIYFHKVVHPSALRYTSGSRPRRCLFTPILLRHHRREPLGPARHSYKYRPNLHFYYNSDTEPESSRKTVLESVQNITFILICFKMLHIGAIMQQQIPNTHGLQATYSLSLAISPVSNNTTFSS